ncbi:MAG: F0F1 ATP synthase subunit delta [Patescibacteria group bacterium]
MLTDLYAAVVSDALALHRETDFFEQPSKDRGSILATQLKSYPEALQAYLLNIPATQAYADLIEAAAFIASGKPLLSLVAREAQIHEAQAATATSESGLLHAFEMFLKEVTPSLAPGTFCAGVSGVLGAYTARVFAADDASTPQLCRVLYREAADFMSAKTGERAAEMQVATALPVAEELKLKQALAKSLQGALVQVTVQRGLLGGGRLFHNGELIDVSWRATLNRLFS